MRLIGAGLPRTATLSQKIGLEMIGVGPCYHMVEVLSDLSKVETWSDALEGRADWDSIFAGYESTVDWPGSFFYKEIVDAFPDAKVLLSVRDPDAWAKSMFDTVYGVLFGDTLMHDLAVARGRVDAAWAGYTTLMRSIFDKAGLLGPAEAGLETGELARAGAAFNDEVRATVPSERLLVWSPADGFGPLCEFLEVPVPDAPFPRVNDSAVFADRIIDAALEVIGAYQAGKEPSGS